MDLYGDKYLLLNASLGDEIDMRFSRQMQAAGLRACHGVPGTRNCSSVIAMSFPFTWTTV